MRGVDVLVGPVERRGRNGGGGQRADLFLVEDTRLERLVGTVDLYGGHLFGGGRCGAVCGWWKSTYDGSGIQRNGYKGKYPGDFG